MGLKHRRGRLFRKRISLPRAERFALLRLMTDALIEHERIETTYRKAQALRMWCEPMIDWGRRIKYLQFDKRSKFVLQQKLERKCDRPETIEKLFNILVDRYRYRPGGFTRILKTRRRYRDDAQMAYIEFIDREGELRTPKPNRMKKEDFSPIQWRKNKHLFGYGTKRFIKIPWWEKLEYQQNIEKNKDYKNKYTQKLQNNNKRYLMHSEEKQNMLYQEYDTLDDMEDTQDEEYEEEESEEDENEQIRDIETQNKKKMDSVE